MTLGDGFVFGLGFLLAKLLYDGLIFTAVCLWDAFKN
jgi:hypothetical protein